MSQLSFYRLFVPKQAVGANLVYFDMFNAASSGIGLRIHSILPVVSGAVAVTGVLGVDLILTRTSAIGTGGTAAVSEGTDTTAMNITAHDHSQPIYPTITARLTPSGGATAGAVLSWRSVFTEETNGGSYNQIFDLACSQAADVEPLKVPAGTGIRVVQGAVASVGNIGFDIIFSVKTP